MPNEPTIIYKPSPNFWTYNNGRRLIVLHGTAGSFQSSFDWLRNPQSEASANYLIDLDGTIYCLVDPFKGFSAWANGALKTPNLNNPHIAWCVKNGINPNLISLSIEHVASEAAMVGHQPMTQAQLQSSMVLFYWLSFLHNLPINRQTIVGHNEIDSKTRGNCPGVIGLDSYVSRLLQIDSELNYSSKAKLIPPTITIPAKEQIQLTENGFILRGEILKYYQALPNPLLVLGHALSNEVAMDADGKCYQVSERAVLEFDPKLIGTGWQVQGRHLGREWLAANGSKQ